MRRLRTREGLLTGETLLTWPEDDGGSDGEADMTSEASKKEFVGAKRGDDPIE